MDPIEDKEEGSRMEEWEKKTKYNRNYQGLWIE